MSATATVDPSAAIAGKPPTAGVMSAPSAMVGAAGGATDAGGRMASASAGAALLGSVGAGEALGSDCEPLDAVVAAGAGDASCVVVDADPPLHAVANAVARATVIDRATAVELMEILVRL